MSSPVFAVFGPVLSAVVLHGFFVVFLCSYFIFIFTGHVIKSMRSRNTISDPSKNLSLCQFHVIHSPPPLIYPDDLTDLVCCRAVGAPPWPDPHTALPLLSLQPQPVQGQRSRPATQRAESEGDGRLQGLHQRSRNRRAQSLH